MSVGFPLDLNDTSTMRPVTARRGHLFVLGHLRSYASLLCHILGSHPQIDGYCETHLRYRWSPDLLRLHSRVRKLTGAPLRGRYVLDQILHDYPMARTILESPRTRAVIIVRRPRDTVRSIIETGRRHTEIPPYRDLERVASYYETRLAALLRLTDALRGRVVFLEAETLLTHAREVLDQLAAFLELDSALQTEYRLFPCTGKVEDGEPSPAISTGRIINAVGDRHTSVSLPRALNTRLQNAYDFWCAALRRSCPQIAPADLSGAEHEDYARG
ncbi:MAG TPA: hypothetical protein VFO44_12505 [Steroidobacteraceae bacterium]|nr:hypothetical protein [Steroidobacteraceae bacterium]